MSCIPRLQLLALAEPLITQAQTTIAARPLAAATFFFHGEPPAVNPGPHLAILCDNAFTLSFDARSICGDNEVLPMSSFLLHVRILARRLQPCGVITAVPIGGLLVVAEFENSYRVYKGRPSDDGVLWICQHGEAAQAQALKDVHRLVHANTAN